MRILATAASIAALTFGFAGAAAAGPDTAGSAAQPAAQTEKAQVQRGQPHEGQYPDSDVDSSREGTSLAEPDPGVRSADEGVNGRPDTLFGYPVSYTYPHADGNEVQPGRIGGMNDPAVSGSTVAEIMGRSQFVAELHEVPSEDTSE